MIWKLNFGSSFITTKQQWKCHQVQECSYVSTLHFSKHLYFAWWLATLICHLWLGEGFANARSYVIRMAWSLKRELHIGLHASGVYFSRNSEGVLWSLFYWWKLGIFKRLFFINPQLSELLSSILHYSDHSNILDVMISEHENIGTDAAYFSFLGGLNAQTHIQTSTNTWIQNCYVCVYYNLKACCNRCKHTLRGMYIRCHLVRRSAARGPYIKMLSRAPGGRTLMSLAPSVTSPLLSVQWVRSTRYCWHEVKFISAKPANVSVTA